MPGAGPFPYRRNDDGSLPHVGLGAARSLYGDPTLGEQAQREYVLAGFEQLRRAAAAMNQAEFERLRAKIAKVGPVLDHEVERGPLRVRSVVGIAWPNLEPARDYGQLVETEIVR